MRTHARTHARTPYLIKDVVHVGAELRVGRARLGEDDTEPHPPLPLLDRKLVGELSLELSPALGPDSVPRDHTRVGPVHLSERRVRCALQCEFLVGDVQGMELVAKDIRDVARVRLLEGLLVENEVGVCASGADGETRVDARDLAAFRPDLPLVNAHPNILEMLDHVRVDVRERALAPGVDACVGVVVQSVSGRMRTAQQRLRRLQPRRSLRM